MEEQAENKVELLRVVRRQRRHPVDPLRQGDESTRLRSMWLIGPAFGRLRHARDISRPV